MPSQENNLRPVEEIPLPYRSVFQDYPCFNVVQSAVLDEAFKTDNSIVVSAPTGSGKTAIFELAIIRLLTRENEVMSSLNKKIIYISPVKALCKERLVDWHKKFSNFGVRCISITGDTDEIDARNMSQYNLIISTPEKWDVLTRRWRENIKLIGAIGLFLIDEVHLLNADSRGSTLEVIVSRMKTAVSAVVLNGEESIIRFVALSATIPNIEDIAEWIGPSGTAKYFKFSEDARPVKLNKIVLGYYFNPQNQSVFKFDMSMNYKLPSLILKYSEGKPTLSGKHSRARLDVSATSTELTVLLGMQSGYTKYCCFLCMWDSRDRKSHYIQVVWPARNLKPSEKNVVAEPLVNPKDVPLPLHIKLGLMKNFVKGLNQDGQTFKYLREKFPKLSDAKVKEGIFVGPQIRELAKDPAFDLVLTGKEKEAWEAFRGVMHGFLGNRREENYTQLVKVVLEKNHQLGFVELSVTSMGKDSTRIFLSWNGDIRAAGMKQCSRITAGLCIGMLQKLLTREKPKDSDLMKPPINSSYIQPPIFCNTRKSVEMTANHLVSNLQIRLTQEQKNILMTISQQLSEAKLRQNIVHGIAFHHAGMAPENRFTIEESFRKGHLPILVTTSTLAMGVNLPAHLVVVKSTKCYSESGYKDYDEVSIFQMIGRAGRRQFDSTATALILTSLQDKEKYQRMLACTQTIESNLHKHLTEHLNAEVVLRTITDLEVAMRWLSSTFLYVRARKSPEKYKLPAGLSKEKIDKKLLDMCQIDLNKLVSTGMIKMNQAIEISPTVVGEIMAKYYVAFETMKLFTQISGSEILIQILALIAKCKEFSKIYLRTNDKRCLNMLNKSSKKESNRFPLTGRIRTVDMKINVIIQAVLGNLEINDQSVLCDSVKIMQNCERLARCLIEYLETRDKCYNALLNTFILAKCFRVKLWENSPYVSKQLTGVGQVISTSLMKAGKTSFKEIANTNPRHIEMIVSRKAPFGSTLVEEASHLPEYNITLQKRAEIAELVIELLNPSRLEEKSTVNLDSMMILLVGDSDNNTLLYEKYTHSYMIENPQIKRTLTIDNQNVEYIRANLISEDWVGIDCESKLELSNKFTVHKENQSKNNCKQTFLDIYMKHVKRAETYKKELLDYLASHPNLAKWVCFWAGPKVIIEKEWSDLSKKLNSHRSGASKSDQRLKRNNEIKNSSKENSKCAKKKVESKEANKIETGKIVRGNKITEFSKNNDTGKKQTDLLGTEVTTEVNDKTYVSKITESKGGQSDQMNIPDTQESKNTQNSTKKSKNPKKKNIKISRSIFRTSSKNKHDKKRNKSKKLNDVPINSDYNIMHDFEENMNVTQVEDEGNYTLDFSTFETSCKNLQSEKISTNKEIESERIISPIFTDNNGNNKNKLDAPKQVESADSLYRSDYQFNNIDENKLNESFKRQNISGDQGAIGSNEQRNNDRDGHRNDNNSDNNNLNTRDKISIDAPLYGKLCDKYKFPSYSGSVKAEGQDGNSENENKETMDNPDSTVENTIFQRQNFFAPQAKKQKKDEYATAFDVFPQKSIKWRSPLVHSPAEKFSPRKTDFCFNFGGRRSVNKEDTRESSDFRLGSQDTNTSSMSSTPFENVEKRTIYSNAPSDKPPRKKAKLQFPLSDQDCIEEGNVSLNTEHKELKALCDPENFGVSTKSRESALNSSQSYVGKYYSDLLMNSQRKRDQSNSTVPEASFHSKSNTRLSENKLETVPESQEISTEGDFAAATEVQFPKPCPSVETKENLPSEGNSKNVNLNMQSFTQPVPLDYYHDPNSKFPRRNCFENKNIPNNFTQNPNLDDYMNTSFETFPNPKYSIEYPQKYFFNSHLNEQSRYPMQTSPYFPQPFHERPAELLPRYPVPSSQHPCLCCGHHRARYPIVPPFYEPCLETITEPHSSWNHVDSGFPPRSIPAYRSRIADIPEDYHFLDQIDGQSWRFADDKNLNSLAASSRGFCRYDNFANPLVNLTERPNLNPTQSAGQRHLRFEQVSSHKPTSEDTLRQQTNMQHMMHDNHQFHELEASTRNVSQLFAATPKPQLSHNRRGFNFIRNRKPLISKEPYFHSSLPPSTQRKMSNFNSFEERLDNIIVPRNSGFSFSATRDQQYDRPTDFDPNGYQNEGREFVMNRFVLPNNRKGTQ